MSAQHKMSVELVAMSNFPMVWVVEGDAEGTMLGIFTQREKANRYRRKHLEDWPDAIVIGVFLDGGYA